MELPFEHQVEPGEHEGERDQLADQPPNGLLRTRQATPKMVADASQNASQVFHDSRARPKTPCIPLRGKITFSAVL